VTGDRGTAAEPGDHAASIAFTPRHRGDPYAERRRGTSPTGLDRGRSSGLDGLRAFSCLIVIAYHLHTVSGFSFGVLDPFVRGLDTGVWMFFALSGYLLYKPFLTRRVDLVGYAIKRSARILPGYYLALVVLALMTGSRLPIESPLAYLSLTAPYDIPLRGFLGNAWTLSVEVLFYVALPAIAWAARGREVALLGSLAAGSVVLAVTHRATVNVGTEWLFGTFPLAFYAFVPGMLLAVLEVRRPDAFRAMGSPAFLASGLVCLIAGALTSNLPVAIGTVVGTPMLMGWLLQRRLPGVRFLTFAGGASYALYLWHKDLLVAFGPAGLAIVLVGSALSWALVERPILARAHWLADTWRARRGLERVVPQPAK
jgi:peptidoglycan/LPS O-acetylase OafA/YrhL